MHECPTAVCISPVKRSRLFLRIVMERFWRRGGERARVQKGEGTVNQECGREHDKVSCLGNRFGRGR